MITMYTKAACPRCRMAKKLLDREGITFQSIDVGEDEVARDALERQGIRSLPVTVGEGMTPQDYIVGFQPERLKTLGA